MWAAAKFEEKNRTQNKGKFDKGDKAYFCPKTAGHVHFAGVGIQTKNEGRISEIRFLSMDVCHSCEMSQLIMDTVAVCPVEMANSFGSILCAGSSSSKSFQLGSLGWRLRCWSSIQISSLFSQSDRGLNGSWPSHFGGNLWVCLSRGGGFGGPPLNDTFRRPDRLLSIHCGEKKSPSI